MKTKKVIFDVGPAHPLYNLPVEAVIECETGGWRGESIHARTINPVHWPADPDGIFVYNTKTGKLIGKKERPAFDEIWSGWVLKVL